MRSGARPRVRHTGIGSATAGGPLSDRPLYDALGLPHDASPEAIRAAWKDGARQHHPDRNPDDAAAAARFREVRAAWEVLGDPERRAWYDEFGDDATSAFFDPDLARLARAARQPTPRPAAPDPRRPIRSRYAVTRGDDLEASLHLEAHEAARGGVFELVVEPARTCAACGGSGWRAGGRACSKCEGGVVPGLGPWRLMLPPGVLDGQRLHVPGEGRKGRGHGAEPGDLWVTCRVAVRWDLAADRPTLQVPTTGAQRRDGGAIRVPLPDGGAVRVRVPAGVGVGQRLRLRGKGPSGRDLFVAIGEGPEAPIRVQAARVSAG